LFFELWEGRRAGRRFHQAARALPPRSGAAGQHGNAEQLEAKPGVRRRKGSFHQWFLSKKRSSFLSAAAWDAEVALPVGNAALGWDLTCHAKPTLAGCWVAAPRPAAERLPRDRRGYPSGPFSHLQRNESSSCSFFSLACLPQFVRVPFRLAAQTFLRLQPAQRELPWQDPLHHQPPPHTRFGPQPGYCHANKHL